MLEQRRKLNIFEQVESIIKEGLIEQPVLTANNRKHRKANVILVITVRECCPATLDSMRIRAYLLHIV